MKERLKRILPKIILPILYLFALFAFLVWTFPFDKLRDRVVVQFNAQQRASTTPQELQIDELESYFGGVRAKGVRLVMPSPEVGKPASIVSVDEARARISFLSLLIGRKDVTFKLFIGGGTVTGEFIEKGKDRDIELEFTDVDLGQIGPVKAQLGVPLDGKLNGPVKLELPEGKASKASGSVNLEVKDVAVGDGKAKLKGMLALPRMQMGNLVLQGEAKDGSIKISKMTADGRDLTVSGDGKIQMRELATESNLDLNIKVKIADAYRKKDDTTKALFGDPSATKGPPALFEMDPVVSKAKLPDNGGYAFMVRGTLGNPKASGAGSGATPGIPGAAVRQLNGAKP